MPEAVTVAAPDVIVVGGGVIGCAITWALAKAGASVTLLERDYVGAHASSVAAGMLAPLTEARHPSGGPGDDALFDLTLRSLDLFPSFADELREATGVDVECVISGLLRVPESPESASRLRERFRWLEGLQRGVQWLDAGSLRDAEPSLDPIAHGALYSPQEGHVQSRRVVQALASAATVAGAAVIEGTPVVSLTQEGDRVTGVRTMQETLSAGEVVLCAGPWADLTEALGYHLPVRPEKGQLLTVRPRQALLRRIVFADTCYLVPRRDGTVLVGATAEDVGYDARPTAWSVGRILEGALRVVPKLAEAEFLGTVAGLRPKTPDRLPVLGPLPGWRGVTLATGHFRNGILLSAITAQLVSELVLTGRSEVLPAPFSPARFVA